MTECASLVDSKVTTAPVLYLPADEGVPASVKQMQAQCKVDVRRLPKSIHHEGELMPEEINTPAAALSAEPICGARRALQ